MSLEKGSCLIFSFETYTLWSDLCHILSSLNKTPRRKLGRILVREHLFGSRNWNLKLKEKKQCFSNFSSRKTFVFIALIRTNSLCLGKTDVSCRSFHPHMMKVAVHHTWLVNKQRISASISQIHLFTWRTFFPLAEGAKCPLQCFLCVPRL